MAAWHAIVVRKKEGWRTEAGEIGGILKLAKQPMCVERGGNWKKSFGISTVATKGDDDTDPLTLIGNGVGGQRERGILLDGYWIDRSGRFG